MAVSKETFEKGRRIREEVLGRERVAKTLDQADSFNRAGRAQPSERVRASFPRRYR